MLSLVDCTKSVNYALKLAAPWRSTSILRTGKQAPMKRTSTTLNGSKVTILLVVLNLIGGCRCTGEQYDDVSSTKQGQFIAGSFILTQKALDEAPYRYSTFLTQALEAMELKDPPTRSDEESCSVRYRIEPSGQRNKIEVDQNSLKVQLLQNWTVEISASMFVQVPAKTWIWKGINFGFLGCMKISSCGGQIVTYSAKIDMKVSFQVEWLPTNNIRVTIKPVDTVLNDVTVTGCKPPWYLWWFKKWQTMLNTGVQSAFQEFADNFSHSLTVPEETAIHNNIFISHKVTNLIWSEHFVAFEATATFKATVQGRNVTFLPSQSSLSSGTNSSFFLADLMGPGIPIDQWPDRSSSDVQSHLLQGVRVSGYLLNSVMWYASITNATEYRGNTTILDSQVNGTISYTPPILTVGEDNKINILVPQGKLLAVCRPIKERPANTSVLFKAEFSELAGTGTVHLSPDSNRTGIVISIDDLDLSNLKTKPFEPKLPLPETFESGLMRTGISQLRPIINQYLQDKPIFLPERVAPLVAYPEVALKHSLGGLGYAEVLSYCTCSDFQAPGAFAKCDERSGLCSNKLGKRSVQSETTSDSIVSNDSLGRDSTVDTENSVPLADWSEPNSEQLPRLVTLLNSSSTFHKVINVANDFINRRIFNNKTDGKAPPPADDGADDSPQMFILRSDTRSMDQTPLYLTQFETNANCSLSVAGDNAKTYRLTPDARCTPITVGRKGSATSQYYVFKPDGSRLQFGCFDKQCKTCTFVVDITQDGVCVPAAGHSQSFMVTRRRADGEAEDGQAGNANSLVDSALAENNGTVSVTIHFDEASNCGAVTDVDDVDGQYAVMLSTTYQLGYENTGCMEMLEGGEYLSVQTVDDFDAADNFTLPGQRFSGVFECSQADCTYCSYSFDNLRLGDCSKFAHATSRIILQQAPYQVPSYVHEESIDMTDGGSYVKMALAVGLSLVLVFGLLIIVALVWCLRTTKTGQRRIAKYTAAIRHHAARITKIITSKVFAFGRKHLGVRLLQWRSAAAKSIFEDIVHNLFLVLNGTCAIVFAFEWNSPNNPLSLFSSKLTSKLGIGAEVLEMSRVLKFTETLNFSTFLVNLINGSLAFALVLMWLVTKSGGRESWTKARLASSTLMLTAILLTIATVIFTTFFDDLIQLKTGSGYFIADNIKMRRITETVVKVSLNGLSLTVISFTIVFLFHGVGGGLFCGTVLFRIFHLQSKKENLEILTTLLVILTIIQPFICLHPVIIWSQDSNHNASYLILTIFVWFLPLLVHLVVKLMHSHINKRFVDRSLTSHTKTDVLQSELTPLNDIKVAKAASKKASTADMAKSKLDKNSRPVDGKTSTKSEAAEVVDPAASPAANRRQLSSRFVVIFDVGMQVVQMIVFLSVFSFVTHYIVNTELDSSRSNLKSFVLPAIVSVFIWMMSISYFLLDLTINATKESTPLVFTDQEAVKARHELHMSLRRRLAHMDRATSLGHYGRPVVGRAGSRLPVRRPDGPPPPPPPPPRTRSRPPVPPKPKWSRKDDLPDTQSNRGKPGFPQSRKPAVPPRPPNTLGIIQAASSRARSLPPINESFEMQRRMMRDAVNEKKEIPKSGDSTQIKIREAERAGKRTNRKEKLMSSDSDCSPDSNSNRQSRIDPNAVEAQSDVNESESGGSELGDSVIFQDPGNASFCAKLVDYVLERREYATPEEHGWRIKFRRIFLHLGVIGFTFTTVETILETQNYSAKHEIQKVLDYVGTNLTWPDEGSALDDVFALYNSTQVRKSYVMIAASLLFWSSLAMDNISYWAAKQATRTWCLMLSRVVNFLGSLLVFASVILVGLPDYLEASNLDKICPYCGQEFNRTVKQVAEFSIGLFFACLFTFQLLPVLMTIAPALVRASVLILIHPGLLLQDATTVLRMSILQKVIVVSSLLSFPITFVSMCIVDQHQKDPVVSALIILFWLLPPITLYLGLHYSRTYQKYSILLYVYYMYNFVYVGLILSLLLYSFQLQQFLQFLRDMLESPSVWFGGMAQVFLCNVVISDLLYMTVF